ncbi:MAG TPA: succinylglutamate desuccinylase/aspartoacylase family protein [Methylophaga aminisulfidivorans]|uniref:Succinylglutamate desuccinylase/aspartoacylase family protein n=2 Tax=root TaxID=1 RepID=A0A7C2AJF6_9GAMM|nr:succinylglutamate desuccinylase/aspartoacylase family protein [Methylophaga aminisulfidivorans]HEC75511.1 succinylglutamate desuccinylase/aspartoacylase family protein [Methylophaga aminisulfidivorans]
MSSTMVLAGEEIKLGQNTIVDIPLPDLYMQTSLSMPVHVIRGRRDGPTIFVSAAVHGDEINGVEIIRRLVKSKSLKGLRGTLIAIPVVNVYGFLNQSRYLPDRRDLNRCFPGSEEGSLAARLADSFMKEVVSKCTHGIDLHTAAIHRDNLPQIRADLSNVEVESMAQAFDAPVVVNSSLIQGSLRFAAEEYDVPVIVYEAGEALRFNEMSIRAGVKGVIGVMRHIGMLSPSRTKKRKHDPFVARSSAWVRSPQSGIFRMMVPMGASVNKGDLLGMVAAPYGKGESETEVLATSSGIVIGRTNIPLVNEGEALFHIARFNKPDEVADSVIAFHSDLDPATDTAAPEEVPII